MLFSYGKSSSRIKATEIRNVEDINNKKKGLRCK